MNKWRIMLRNMFVGLHFVNNRGVDGVVAIG